MAPKFRRIFRRSLANISQELPSGGLQAQENSPHSSPITNSPAKAIFVLQSHPLLTKHSLDNPDTFNCGGGGGGGGGSYPQSKA